MLDKAQNLYYNKITKGKEKGEKIMKIYVVCEDYTCAFYGLYNNVADAKQCADEIGGFVKEYKMENGQLIEVED